MYIGMYAEYLACVYLDLLLDSGQVTDLHMEQVNLLGCSYKAHV